MSDDAFNARLRLKIMATFEAEARERLQAITNSLLELEQNTDPKRAAELLTDIFREAHTLKGSARGLNLEDVGKVAHKMENIFSRLQTGALKQGAAIFDVVYKALDGIGMLVKAAATNSPSNVELDELCATLEAALEPAPVSTSTTAAPASNAGKSSIMKGVLESPASQSGLRPVEINVIVTEMTQKPSEAAASAPIREFTTPQGAADGGGKGSEESGKNAEAAAQSEMVISKVREMTAAAPSQESAPTAKLKNQNRASEETVRVAIAKMDTLMAQVGEIQVTRVSTLRRLAEIGALLQTAEAWDSEWGRARADCRKILRTTSIEGGDERGAAIGEIPRNLPVFLRNNEANLKSAHSQLSILRRNLKADSRRMAQVVADLQDEVRGIRMLPIATVFQTFPRMIRDLARELGKEIDFAVQGGDNEMDRSVIEQIGGPLIHLLRNCVDHGLEMPDVREAAGKSRKGRLVLSASQRGGSILIEVADDGAGIDGNKVKASAVKKGVIKPEEAAAMTERESVWLIFRSGVSTRTAVSEISGRGVGMDVVRETIEKMNGIIDVETHLGRGSRFSLTLPLTVATTLSLMVQAQGLTFALPVANIIRIMKIKHDQIGSAGGRAVVHVDGRPIALVHLAQTLKLDPSQGSGSPRKGSNDRLAIIVGSVDERMAFIVDSVLGSQEVMVKSLPNPLLRVPRIAGATILGTGEVVIMLNAADLTRSGSGTLSESNLSEQSAEVAIKPKSLLVVDDSATIRSLEKSILEAAGYRVTLAGDGSEAWEMLQNEKFDVVVSDINMPKMDGIELTMRIRGHASLKDTPVVLVTSLGSATDKEKGIQAGADAYIIKSSFEQEILLSTISGLL